MSGLNKTIRRAVVRVQPGTQLRRKINVLALSCGHTKIQKASAPIPKLARCVECERIAHAQA